MAHRTVFMGTPLFAVPSLVSLIDAGYEVAAVVTQPDKPRGRGLGAMPSPVKKTALERGIPVLEPEKLRDEAFIGKLKALGPEFIAVVAYGKILPASILDMPPRGCINVHASLLPKYRGAAPINWAIINGEKETGVTTMVMDAGMDTGPVLLTERVPIGDDDTAEDLAVRLSAAGGALLVRTLTELFKDGLRPMAQDNALASYAPILKKEDGRIDWGKSAKEVKDLVRGVYPWPGAFTGWNGVLKVHSGRVSGAIHTAEPPGTVIALTGDAIAIACGSGVFEITELQPENRKRMGSGDFIKGYRIKRGDRLV